MDHEHQRTDRQCNLPWHNLFKNANVKHLPRTWSDHHPLLLDGLVVGKMQHFKGFCSLDLWLTHANFEDVVKRCWECKSGNLQEVMERAKEGMMKWNEEEFGNIFQRKR